MTTTVVTSDPAFVGSVDDESERARLERMRLLIQAEIERRGLSQRSVARMAGLSPGQVGHIVRGRTRNPSSDTMLKVARALDLRLDVLMGREIELPPDAGGEPDERRAASEFARANRVPGWAIRETLEDAQLRTANMTAEDWYYAMRLRAKRGP